MFGISPKGLGVGEYSIVFLGSHRFFLVLFCVLKCQAFILPLRGLLPHLMEWPLIFVGLLSNKVILSLKLHFQLWIIWTTLYMQIVLNI